MEIKKFIKSNRVLFKNFTSLSILQLANYLFPLITLPYIVRILGAANYGLVQFALTLTSYFVLVTDYGFNLSATKQISVHRDDDSRVKSIFSAVLFSKILLGSFSTILLTLLIFSIDKLSQNANVFFASFGIIVGMALFPLWYFQGKEKMHLITLINFFPKLIGTASIFLLITEKDDFVILVYISSAIQLTVGISGLLTVMIKDKVFPRIPKPQEILYQLKDGFNLFSSTVFINLYTNSYIIILGFLTTDTIVGYFAAADKIRLASQSFTSILSQSVYPRINYLYQNSKEKFLSFNRKLLRIQIIINFLISASIFLSADLITQIFLGDGFDRSASVIKILAWIPFIVSISNVFGIQTLLVMDKTAQFFRIVFTGAMISLASTFYFIPILNENGAAVSFLLTEIFITTSMGIAVHKNGINYFQRKDEV